MSFKKLCVATLIFILGTGCMTLMAKQEKRLVAKAEEKIMKHSEPRYRNTFMAYTPEEIKCMAMNIYHEARNESLAGKVAVLLVTMNRVIDKRFPNTICGVVHEGKHRYNRKKDAYYPIRDRCQFSWYCDGKDDIPRNKRAYVYSIALTKYFLKRSMMIIDFTEGATHYHADYIDTPRWAKKGRGKIKTVQIDTHIFYRWDQ